MSDETRGGARQAAYAKQCMAGLCRTGGRMAAGRDGHDRHRAASEATPAFKSSF